MYIRYLIPAFKNIFLYKCKCVFWIPKGYLLSKRGIKEGYYSSLVYKNRWLSINNQLNPFFNVTLLKITLTANCFERFKPFYMKYIFHWREIYPCFKNKYMYNHFFVLKSRVNFTLTKYVCNSFQKVYIFQKSLPSKLFLAV